MFSSLRNISLQLPDAPPLVAVVVIAGIGAAAFRDLQLLFLRVCKSKHVKEANSSITQPNLAGIPSTALNSLGEQVWKEKTGVGRGETIFGVAKYLHETGLDLLRAFVWLSSAIRRADKKTRERQDQLFHQHEIASLF